MTTTAPTNGHRVSPPFLESESDLQPPVASASSDAQHAAPAATDAPASERQNAPFPASAYHVPPKLFTPKADSFRNTIPEGWGRTKLPERCQFMFSDGRQCTMARSDIHPSLCVYHSDREEQLFGDPGHRCEAKTLDFPELHSACRDLSTARGVNRALAQVFRMLARGRISRQEAATFAKLGQLLLQSISGARAESADPIRIGVPSEHREPRDLSGPAPLGELDPVPSPDNRIPPPPAPSTASFGREDHEGSPENPIASEACPIGQSGRHESGHESSHGQSTIRGSSDAESRCAQNSRKQAHPPQNEHLRGAAFEPPYNQHLRNRKTSSSSESTLAEMWEGSDSIARR